jgi:uncharacterized RDD family membrane protein YckC
MNTDFEDVMSKQTDEELIKIVSVDRNNYQSLAVIAAEEEIKKRRIDTTRFEQVENELSVKIEEAKQFDNKKVTSLTRFVHFIIDSVIVLIIVFILTVPLDANVESQMLIGYVIIFIIIFGYYYILEAKYQKTVAKFITKTKVVTNDGKRPDKHDILIRTLCRFIPFDQVTYLFTRNGLHDRFSDTVVIKENV